MSETAVRVDLREATLSESAKLHEGDGDPFIDLDHPPPVRSLLRLSAGEDVRAFEVGRVIEVVDEHEPARGCYGTFVDLERLEEQRKVGSEHLEPGISGSGGIPAPVMMSPSDMMLTEAGSDEDEAAAAADEGKEGDAESSDDAQAESESADESDSEPDSEPDEPTDD